MKLCADAGGTSIRIGYADDAHKIILKKKYPINRFRGGEAGIVMALNEFIQETKEVIPPKSVNAVVISVAGPVRNSQVQFTNTDWFISKNNILENFSSVFGEGLIVDLINDFEALAYGLATIEDEDATSVYPKTGYGDTRIICGPGTGLGLAALKQQGDELIDLTVIPSEGGHQTFPVETTVERDFHKYMMQEWLSYEHILSGDGLQRLYGFFSQQTHVQYAKEQSPEEIINHYSSGNVAARQALEAFALALGSFCGNMILALGATRGVYLWGGILKSFPHEMLRTLMMQRLQQRGRGSANVMDVPVYKVTTGELALRGCSIYFQREQFLRSRLT